MYLEHSVLSREFTELEAVHNDDVDKTRTKRAVGVCERIAQNIAWITAIAALTIVS